jgi:hypothetical protein
MSNHPPAPTRRGTLAAHILPVSGTMIGVCATLIGLAKIAQPTRGPSHVDELAAIAAITFLASALTSYLSIRFGEDTRRGLRLERIADLIFLAGLVGITLVATLFAYEVI